MYGNLFLGYRLWLPANDRAAKHSTREGIPETMTSSDGLTRLVRCANSEPEAPLPAATAARRADIMINTVNTSVSPDSNLASENDVYNYVSFGFLNANSVGNKFTSICDEIFSRKLEICLLNETWHSVSNDTALRRCVPEGYSLHDVPRKSTGNLQNHGGVAAIVSNKLTYRAVKPFFRTDNI